MNWRITQTDREAGVVMLTCPGLDWDSFPTLAESLLQEWELAALEREWGRIATAGCWSLKAAAFGSSTNITAAAGWRRCSRTTRRRCSGWLGSPGSELGVRCESIP